MSTGNPLSIVARAALVATCVITSVSCGGELLRTGRSPVYLLITSITATQGGEGGEQDSAFLQSDVQVLVERDVNGQTVQVPTVFNDNATVTVRVEAKNPSLPTSSLNAVTLTRYRVSFRRSDGRSTPGVDVPFGFDGAVSGTADPGSTFEVSFELVRHQAKLEPPLRNLIGFGGLGFLSTVADITIWGRDQNGNEVMATGSIDVHFADFADPD